MDCCTSPTPQKPGKEKLRKRLWAVVNQVLKEVDVTVEEVAMLVAAFFGVSIVLGLALAVLFAFVWAIPTWLCWNLAAAPVLGLSQISFWQAFGLAMLARILIKSGNINLNVK